MSNPTTKIDCQPANSLRELYNELCRQCDVLRDKKAQAKELHLHNPFEIDYFELQGMAIRILQGEYGFSENQAHLIEAKCFKDNQFNFEYYLLQLPGYARFAKDIINTK